MLSSRSPLRRPLSLPDRWMLLVLTTLGTSFLALLSLSIPPITVQAQTAPDASDTATSQPQSRSLTLGVVQSTSNRDHWQRIVNRLEAAGLSYRVIDWDTVGQDSDFSGMTVLLLPGVETVSSEQALALQTWVNQGGYLIATGATGTDTSTGVGRALRSLLGAYWNGDFSEPANLDPITLNRQRWLRDGNTTEAIAGGILIPTGLGSESVATWDRSPLEADISTRPADAVAIVVTRQTIFLGWDWGSGVSSAEFDHTWLTAVLGHFPDAPQPATSAPTASTPISPEPSPVPSPVARSPRPAAEPAASSPDRPSTNSPSAVAPLLTPDRQVAPPGLLVEPSNRPLSLVEALRMRQELENLIGRYESAVLAANAIDRSLEVANQLDANLRDANLRDTNLRDTNFQRTTLTASAAPTLPLDGLATEVPADAHSSNAILQEAKQQLRSFLEQVRQQDYGAAREIWLETRQLVWDNFPTDRPLAQAEIRAVWLDRGTIVEARNKRRLAQIFDRLAEAGINTVFFETVNAGYPIYPSQVAPQQNPLTRRWDPLAAAVELAHERGMELHAWVWTFAAGNEAHNRIVNLPLHYPGPLLEAHPEWSGYDRQGNSILPGQEEPFLDPANPAARRYLLQLFEEIVTHYEVDGLQLDYIRYPFQDPSANRTYGYGTAARQQFQQRTGVDPITLSPTDSSETGRQLWQQWTEFRIEQVNSFVAETAELLDRLNPDLILSAAVFPMPTEERLRKIQQNWETWAQQGDVDMIVIMSYAADTNRLQQIATPWLTGENGVDLGSTLVIPGIRILDLPDAMVFDQIQALRDLPSEGYALFATAHLQDNLEGILQRTQGAAQTAPIPYRQPFAAVADRYLALQREWDYLMAQDQLWLREADRAAWQTQVQTVADVLQALAEDPSSSNLDKARTELQILRTNFDAWMQLQALTEGYRIQTWNYRLATLDELLNYGERVALQ